MTESVIERKLAAIAKEPADAERLADGLRKAGVPD